MKEGRESLEHALEEAVSRALRDNLAPLQRTASELQQAFTDLVAACSSTKPSNALPAMLRAQSSASALAAGLSVLSNFIAVALNPPAGRSVVEEPARQAATAVVELDEKYPVPAAVAEEHPESEWAEETPDVQHEPEEFPLDPEVQGFTLQAKESEVLAGNDPEPVILGEEISLHSAEHEPIAPPEPMFNLATLSAELQSLHQRANRVAKVTMQDIKLLHPKDVQLGRERKDICQRLRSDLDKARKEYDRRFRAIQDHPVDYFHRWMVEILAEGNTEALGEYPYPSPVLRH